MEFLLIYGILVNSILLISAKLPDYIHVCKRSDPDINKCIQNTMEELRPYLIKGMPELNVPSIEPLYIAELVATEGNGLKVVTKDLKAYGGSNFTILHMDVDVSSRKFNFKLAFPNLRVEGQYEVDGKIIMIPIKGSGQMHADVYNIEASIILDSQLNTHDGEEFIQFTDMKIDIEIGSGKIHLSNLFGGDKLIGDVINSAINLNFQYFIKELKPTIEKTLSAFIIDSANHIVDKVPYKDAFPE